MQLLSDREMQEWMERSHWIFARTMKEHPHEYVLRREQHEQTFLRVVATIWTRGYDRKYLGRPWRSLDVGEDWHVWICTPYRPDAPPPLRDTILINRAVKVQLELGL